MPFERFLHYGDEGNTFHVAATPLAVERAPSLVRCLAADGPKTVSRIVAISESGLAPKNDPAIFSLAVAAKLGDEPTRRAAYAAMPRVCRDARELMAFATHAQRFGGWGRGMRKAVGAWFNGQASADLAAQLAQSPASNGWSIRDLLRLAHPRAATGAHDRLFAWAIHGALPPGPADEALARVEAVMALRTAATSAEAASLVRTYRLPAACVPERWQLDVEVWDALVEAMSPAAVLSHLATIARAGLLEDGAMVTARVAAQLSDATRLGAHPLAILSALVACTVEDGAIAGAIVEALDAAFHESLALVAPIGRRVMIALDASSSMSHGAVGGVQGLTPRLASAAMAMVTAASERTPMIAAFASECAALSIDPRERLGDVVARAGRLPDGKTDHALPMVWAKEQRVDVDAFVIYSDNDLWTGGVQPVQALRGYREARGIPAKLIVVGMTSSGFGFADPDDAGMLDVIGFDPSTPPVIADFARA